jgi:L-threonylcarbamoyladenylate synthase
MHRVKETQVLPATDPQALSRALDVLQAGGLVAFPTDTVYGLGALIQIPASIQALYAVKGRQAAKAIPVLLSSSEELDRVVQSVSFMVRRLAEKLWPGPLTLVVPRRPDLPAELSSQTTIGVRMPDHPVALALLRLTGPLAVTSANRSGEASSVTAQEVADHLGGRIEIILDGGQTPGGISSTVVDCSGDTLVILRQGPVSLMDLLEALA